MRVFVVWLSRVIVGTIAAPDHKAAWLLATAMWGDRDVCVGLDTECHGWEIAIGQDKDDAADAAGRETEILYQIGRES